MNIKELNERIEQLTKLVISADETIKNAKEMIVLAEQERDRLCDQQCESEPKFERVKYGYNYYYVDVLSEGLKVCMSLEGNSTVINQYYSMNNYFHTKERAQEVADKINFLLKLERLHDIYCPDYVPDWKNQDEPKYSVFYDHRSKQYRTSKFSINDYKNNAFFATQEIAQKVCDILNAEERSKDV